MHSCDVSCSSYLRVKVSVQVRGNHLPHVMQILTNQAARWPGRCTPESDLAHFICCAYRTSCDSVLTGEPTLESVLLRLAGSKLSGRH
jgi:hypothetical protein